MKPFWSDIAVSRTAQPAPLVLTHAGVMRFINMYLVGYVILLVGAVLVMWKTGILGYVSPAWLGIGAIVAVGLGIMLSVSAGKPEISR